MRKKFRGQFLIVTGQVTEVKDEGGIVLLTPPKKEPKVTCRFNPESPTVKERAKPPPPGDKVKVLGESITGDLDFSRCEDLTGTP